MSLADAQTLAIRRLLSKSAYDSNIAPGPPLPKSHPPPALLAKLHIECASLYSSARLLAKTPGASKNSSSSGDSGKDVSSDLRRYLNNQASLHSALSHKWLGVEAGEKGGTDRGGEAVAFLQWSRKELEDIKDGGKLMSLGSAEKEKEERWKSDINNELTSVNVFYKYYKKINDTVSLFKLSFPSILLDIDFGSAPFSACSNAEGSAVSYTWRKNCFTLEAICAPNSGLWSWIYGTCASANRATSNVR